MVCVDDDVLYWMTMLTTSAGVETTNEAGCSSSHKANIGTESSTQRGLNNDEDKKLSDRIIKGKKYVTALRRPTGALAAIAAASSIFVPDHHSFVKLR
jgi:hypothetical protein